MKIYKFLKAAEEDLINIAEYTISKWGIAQGRIYKIGLHECFDALANSPFLGRDASEFPEKILLLANNRGS